MPGAEVIELLVSWVVTTALSFVVVMFDERRLCEEQLERAWPPSSRSAALVAFGVLALPFHFAKTRGTWTSAREESSLVCFGSVGIAIAGVVLFASSLLITGIAYFAGLPASD